MQQTDMFDNSLAVSSLEARFRVGALRAETLMNRIKVRPITDILIPHGKMEFFRGNGGDLELGVVREGQLASFVGIHPHALSQMCSKVKAPLQFIKDLLDFDGWGDDLARRNLNTLFANRPFQKQNNEPAQFLLRLVNNKVQGFLSRRYALHLSTTPLIDRFMDYCEEQGALPIDATWSDTRMQVQCAMPHLYQPFPRQNIVIGMSFFNSDFGAGTFSVYPAVLDVERGFSMMLPEYSLGATMTKELFKKIHLGPLIHAKDLNVIGSDRAYRTDEVGQQMRSNMRERLSPEFCRSVCQVIAKAYTTTTSWSSIKRALMGPLLKEELRCVEQMLKERNAKLPALTLDSDGLPVPSNWWAAQAVSFLASTEDDPDRKIDLQYAAGKFLTKTP